MSDRLGVLWHIKFIKFPLQFKNLDLHLQSLFHVELKFEPILKILLKLSLCYFKVLRSDTPVSLESVGHRKPLVEAIALLAILALVWSLDYFF